MLRGEKNTYCDKRLEYTTLYYSDYNVQLYILNISHNHMAVQFVVKLQLIAVHITTSVFVVSSKKLPGLWSYNNREAFMPIISIWVCEGLVKLDLLFHKTLCYNLLCFITNVWMVQWSAYLYFTQVTGHSVPLTT